jgi:hypothetical protein
MHHAIIVKATAELQAETIPAPDPANLFRATAVVDSARPGPSYPCGNLRSPLS